MSIWHSKRAFHFAVVILGHHCKSSPHILWSDGYTSRLLQSFTKYHGSPKYGDSTSLISSGVCSETNQLLQARNEVRALDEGSSLLESYPLSLICSQRAQKMLCRRRERVLKNSEREDDPGARRSISLENKLKWGSDQVSSFDGRPRKAHKIWMKQVWRLWGYTERIVSRVTKDYNLWSWRIVNGRHGLFSDHERQMKVNHWRREERKEGDWRHQQKRLAILLEHRAHS